MITVDEAYRLIMGSCKSYGSEYVAMDAALGRILASDLLADRDLPPFNRVAMDGIAIRFEDFERGARVFRIMGTQPAGATPIELDLANSCIEIMTGAALPPWGDTVIRYEDVEIKEGSALVQTGNVRKGQNVHRQGADKSRGNAMATAGQHVTPALIGIAASIGARELQVKKLPRVLLVSTGNELAIEGEEPGPFGIRQSNIQVIQAALRSYGIESHLDHIRDDPALTSQRLERSLLMYDVVVLSGGVSMGRYDYVPAALESAGVKPLFHKVKQKPGKPLWVGENADGAMVFAFPGNPVSAFLCLHRYLLPWLNASLGRSSKPVYALLTEDYHFNAELTVFLQVQVEQNETAQLLAKPVIGNGSGDFGNLAIADAFLELPEKKEVFSAGEVFRLWPFRYDIVNC